MMSELQLALIAFFIAQIADAATTRYALKRGGREVNPVLRWAMKNLGRDGWVVFKAGLATLSAGALAILDVTLGIWFLTFVTGAIAIRNVWVIRR